MGHVNNAAYWTAVEHRLSQRGVDLRRPLSARLEYRHPIDLGEAVELVDVADAGGYTVRSRSEAPSRPSRASTGALSERLADSYAGLTPAA